MMDFWLNALATYAITLVITSSSIFERIRFYVIEKTPFLIIGSNRHFIECRMCLGFWISIIICYSHNQINLILPVYGLSYFMATQERK